MDVLKDFIEPKQPPDGAYVSPYKDPHVREHQWHAVVKDCHDLTVFFSSGTEGGLKTALSQIESVKQVLAIFKGSLVDFSETRNVQLHLPS